MPGVVCLPHGWAPDSPGTWDAEATSGPNINVLTPGQGMDPLTGTAVLNAVPVHLHQT
jgi:anaerobic selenocysteine-containing dehydrogenase